MSSMKVLILLPIVAALFLSGIPNAKADDCSETQKYTNRILEKIKVAAITKGFPESDVLRMNLNFLCSAFSAETLMAESDEDGKINFSSLWISELRTEDELAFLLGHEVSHFLLHHQMRSYIPYKELRKHETEADLLGLSLMVTASFNPRQSISLMNYLEQISPDSNRSLPSEEYDHPTHYKRINDLMKAIKKNHFDGDSAPIEIDTEANLSSVKLKELATAYYKNLSN